MHITTSICDLVAPFGCNLDADHVYYLRACGLLLGAFRMHIASSICDLAASLGGPFGRISRLLSAIWRLPLGAIWMLDAWRLPSGAIWMHITSSICDLTPFGWVRFRCISWRVSATWRPPFGCYLDAFHDYYLRSGGLPSDTFWMHITTSICSLAATLSVPFGCFSR